MADLISVRRWAEALIALHLDPNEWSFDFDSAKRRAGLTNFTHKRITVSRYLAACYGDDEIHQILLHEVAHAIAGPRAGHGQRWRQISRNLGYVGERTHDGVIAHEHAPWIGTCPRNHVHYRYRTPNREMSCGSCGRGFNTAYLISWHRRRVSQ
jgi:predicted SprT family Zn-dependent metalloprotease